MMVTEVQKLEPLPLRKAWMNELAQAVAFLESLNLAHGDLRPENILLDRNRLKLSDFDCAAKIGTDLDACIAPYGRILNSNETDQGRRGTSGLLGPRTELFALGSLYHLINYGFEVYGDRCLTDDPNEHGPKVVDLLQNMEFSTLDGDPLIDDIIYKCWHNEYSTVVALAAHIEMLLTEDANGEKETARGNSTNTELISVIRWPMSMIHELWCSLRSWLAMVQQDTSREATHNEVANGKEANGNSCGNIHQVHSVEDFSSEKTFCQAWASCPPFFG